MDIRNMIEGLIFINGSASDAQRQLIDRIIAVTTAKLLSKLDKEIVEVPEKLQYIVVEVSIKRFNKIGSEGMRSESVEGHKMEFNSHDFDEYENDINKFLDETQKISKKVVRFI